MKKIFIGIFILLSVSVSAISVADSAGKKTVTAAIKKMMPKVKPDSIEESPVPGMYEVVFGAQVVYVSEDGRYVLEGDLFDMKKQLNVTERKRQKGRTAVVASLDQKSLIDFNPEKKLQYTITAFTDIDCGYCRKLHNNMAEYNNRGIGIRYAAFPRSGVNTPSYYKAVSVWCAKDRQKAMSFAKGGAKLEQLKELEQVAGKECESQIKKHMSAAKEVGVTGTPTLILENGQVLPGFVEPDQLIRILITSGKS